MKLASGNVIVRDAVGQLKVSNWLIIGIIVFESGSVQVLAAVIAFENNPVKLFAILRSQKVALRKVLSPLFVCVDARTISPPPADTSKVVPVIDRPVPSVISSIAPVQAVFLPNSLLVDILSSFLVEFRFEKFVFIIARESFG